MIFQKQKKSYGLFWYIGFLAVIIGFFMLSLERLEVVNFEKSCLILTESVR